jgi:hypothetical protein
VLLPVVQTRSHPFLWAALLQEVVDQFLLTSIKNQASRQEQNNQAS